RLAGARCTSRPRRSASAVGPSRHDRAPTRTSRWVASRTGSGDQVTVHYTGALADGGRQFDSSRSRGEPIQFILGRGKVIRGWDQGLKMMCLGERGILHVPSYKGYGTDGAPPAIPPNAALDFDVELLGINGKFAPQYEPPLAPRPANNSVALGARPGGGRAASAARGAGARGASPGAGAALAAAAGCAVLAAA
ncbi:unnamed protein product, partial [Prorocentrum cordatum]